ncbi:uncharacterized protein JCM10292_005042 [Rhodotorula paludigena]|uniref:uncharacterized protein n=1 Tax=Rhodotorula paludigena TaxID=86838 RepID=UPI00316BD091
MPKTEYKLTPGEWYLPCPGSPVEVQLTKTGCKTYPAFVVLETIWAQGKELFGLRVLTNEEKHSMLEDNYQQRMKEIGGCKLNVQTTMPDGKQLPLGLHK